MVSFRPILTTATPEFSLAWQWYEEAFPAEERRSLEQQQTLLPNPKYQFLAILQEEKPVGFFGLWILGDFTFLEHFAIAPANRGEGLGKKALEAIRKTTPWPVLLEVEPPLTELAKRRIQFYERACFQVNELDYRQPPYGAGKPWVQLLLMSYPDKIPATALAKMKGQIYREVYQQPF